MAGGHPASVQMTCTGDRRPMVRYMPPVANRVYAHIQTSVHAYRHHAYMHRYVCIRTHRHEPHTCIHTFIRVYAYVYVCVCMCMYVYVYVYVYGDGDGDADADADAEVYICVFECLCLRMCIFVCVF